MKKHIDRITETCIHLSEQLKERDTLSFGDCEAVELLINDMQLELEHIRCELYEAQHESCLEHVVDLANVPDFELEDVPF